MLSPRELFGIDLSETSEIANAVCSTIGAGIGCYVVWRSFTEWHRRRSLWRYISELREREDNFRSSLRNKLEIDADKWLTISQVPFDELVGKLQSGELTATEALRAYQYKALLATEKTNAVAQFVQNAEEIAKKLDESTGPKKPLHGVPFSLKEAYFLKGTESTGGLAYYLGKSIDKENAPLVEFLIEQGCVPFIKTNIPQAMLTMDSRNAIYGITRNPHDLTRSPGGSSSGEAAILCQRGSIIGMGSDIAGQDLITYGFLTRDVSSLVALHRLFYSAQTFAVLPKLTPLPFREDIFSSSKPLRIGYYTNLPNTTDTVPAMRRAVLEAKEMLVARGHELVEFQPPDVAEAWVLMVSLMFAGGDEECERALGRDVEIAYPNKHLFLWSWPLWLRKIYANTFGRYLGSYTIKCMYAMTVCKKPREQNARWRKQLVYQEKFMTAFRAAGLDALLCPPTPCPALPLDAPREMVNAVYTGLFNLLNWPAGVLTVSSVTKADEDAMIDYPEYDVVHKTIKQGLTPSETVTSAVGLPLAVQIAVPWFGEEIVLRLLRELEESMTLSSSV